MQPTRSKSLVAVGLDCFRFLLILGATAYSTFRIWQWSPIAAVLAGLPVYFLMLNLFGFLTLPLYMLTPEVRRSRALHRTLLNRLSK